MATQIGPYTQSEEARRQYDARWKRVMDCVNLKQPDRMPVALYCTFWLAKYGGITFRQAMYDHARMREIGEAACLDFEPDVYFPANYFVTGSLWEAIGYQAMSWPGHGVGDDQPYQYIDREYVRADELDEFLFDPTGFYLSTYLPRVATIFEGLAPLSTVAGSIDTIPFIPGMFTTQDMRRTLNQLQRAGEEADRLAATTVDLVTSLAAKGFPMMGFELLSYAPYDFVADYFRGATETMKDIYRRGDKLLEVIDKVRVLVTRRLLEMAKTTSNPFVFIPIHWAPNQFMSQKHFEAFWWPSFRRMMIDITEAGLIPLVMWESDCSRRLETIRDIPPGKCVYWFERTDMVRAFEVLGDIVALRGNLSASVMNMGKPDDVDAAVKHLVDNVWNKGGKLILDTAFGIPDEAPIENVRAMFTAARKYAG